MTQRPPLQGVAGRAAAWVYSKCIDYRNRRFDARKGVTEFDRPVISVGNLSTGGTGKTPLVKWIIEKLIAAGHDPCIAMRGYKSKEGLSDEAQEYADWLPDVPRVVQADRTRGLIELFGTDRGMKVDVVVLDDGFQHRQIARQCDVVVIDATRSPFSDRLLPAGHLREQVESLKRADACVLTRVDLVAAHEVEEICRRIQEVCSAAIVKSSHRWRQVQIFEGAKVRSEPVEALRGKKVVACCAIGNPSAFFVQVKNAGAIPIVEVALSDHDHFDEATVRRVLDQANGSDGVILTEKDWVKVRRHAQLLQGSRVWCPRVSIELIENEAGLFAAIGKVFDRV